MKCFLVKVQSSQFGSVFAPAYAEDQKVINKYGDGQVIRADIHKPRNPGHHRLVFALAKLTLENMPHDNKWSSVYRDSPQTAPYLFIKAMMLDMGIVDIYLNLDGTVRRQPKAINFEDMDEDEFQPVSQGMFEICAKILNVSVDDLHKNYGEYF
jgi:hypothetical protein